MQKPHTHTDTTRTHTYDTLNIITLTHTHSAALLQKSEFHPRVANSKQNRSKANKIETNTAERGENNVESKIIT